MSQGPPPQTVGARLREAREKRGVSLRQIANTTRISVMSLEAVERSDLARLPGGIFTRSFIRAYAEEVGLDPDRTIQDFIAELPAESVVANARQVAALDGEEIESDRTAAATALKLVLVSLPIAGFVIYYTMRQPPPRPSTAAAPSRMGAQPAGGAAAALADAAPASLAMVLAPTSDCWVSVTVDGVLQFSGVMHAGERREIT